MVYLPQTPNAYTDPKLTKQLIKSNISVFKVNPSKPRNITEVVAQTPSDPTGPNSKPNGKGKFILKKIIIPRTRSFKLDLRLYFYLYSYYNHLDASRMLIIAYIFSPIDFAEHPGLDHDVPVQLEERNAQTTATKKEPQKTQYNRIWTSANCQLVLGRLRLFASARHGHVWSSPVVHV